MLILIGFGCIMTCKERSHTREVESSNLSLGKLIGIGFILIPINFLGELICLKF